MYDEFLLPSLRELEERRKQRAAKYVESQAQFLEQEVNAILRRVAKYYEDHGYRPGIGLAANLKSEVVKVMSQQKEAVKEFLEKRLNELSPDEYHFTIFEYKQVRWKFVEKPVIEKPQNRSNTCEIL